MISYNLEQQHIFDPIWIIPHLKFSKHSLLICGSATGIAEHSNRLLHHMNVCEVFVIEKLVKCTLFIKEELISDQVVASSLVENVFSVGVSIPINDDIIIIYGKVVYI